MNLVPERIVRSISRNSLLAQRSSPEVLFVAGVVGLVGSTVLACRATLKVDGVLEEAQVQLKKVRETESEKYSDSDRSHDVMVVQVQTGVKLVKLYAPSIIVGAMSIAALTTSHNILKSRNVALTAAYTALEKGFNQYRDRVRERYGDDADRDLRYGTRKEKVVDPETGRSRTVTRVGTDVPSIYARFFDPAAPSWSPDPEYNLLFLRCQQDYMNDLLRARGHVFLNEAYDALGIPRSKAGAVVGWVMTKGGGTDNFVDFGVFEGREQVSRDFVNGHEGAILLDFNVDGVIYHKLGE